MSRETRELEEIAKLMVLTRKVALYKYYLTIAMAFFIYGMIITAALLIAVCIVSVLRPPIPSQFSLIYLGSVAVAVIIGIFIIDLAVPICKPEEIGGKRVNFSFRYMLSFSIPYAIAYSLPIFESYYHIIWYPALAVALLLCYLFLERPIGLGSKAYLIAGSITLVTTPIVFLVDMYYRLGPVLGLALMLISSTASGIYGLYKGKKIFE